MGGYAYGEWYECFFYVLEEECYTQGDEDRPEWCVDGEEEILCHWLGDRVEQKV